MNLKASEKVSFIVNLASSNKSSTTKLIVFLSTDAILSNLFVINGLCKTSRATVQPVSYTHLTLPTSPKV